MNDENQKPPEDCIHSIISMQVSFPNQESNKTGTIGKIFVLQNINDFLCLFHLRYVSNFISLTKVMK